MFRRWFRSLLSPVPRRRTVRRFHPQAEALESRELLSAVVAPGVKEAPASAVKSAAPNSVGAVTSHLEAGVLVVRGTDNADSIRINQTTTGLLRVFSTTTTGGRTPPERMVRFNAHQVRIIVVDAGGGNDIVLIEATMRKRAFLYGGYGNDSLYGGAGADQIYGGQGHDKIYGRDGDDILVGGTGNDVIAGGRGTNRVFQETFNRPGGSSAIEQEIVRLTNLERARQGLPALRLDNRLANAARLHSNQMASQSATFGRDNAHSHYLWGTQWPTPMSRIDYAGFPHTSIRENIAYRFGVGNTTAAQVVTAWMNSPGHRANILSADITHLGVGVSVHNGTFFYTQNFARLA